MLRPYRWFKSRASGACQLVCYPEALFTHSASPRGYFQENGYVDIINQARDSFEPKLSPLAHKPWWRKFEKWSDNLLTFSTKGV